MTQKVQVTRVSDLDESIEADETVRFALDGTDYEIDLTSGQAQDMRSALSRFTQKARRVRGRGRSAGKRETRADLPDIRAFARARGYTINSRGRVPERIVAEYDELKRLSESK